MSSLAIAQSTFAIAVVAVLLGLFLLLLVGSFVRARRGPPGGSAAAPSAAAPAGPQAVVSRRDFLRGGLVSSLAVFTAQFGGASIAFLWPQIKGAFGSVIQLTDTADAIKGQIDQQGQPYYFGKGRFYIINYEDLGGTGANSLYQGLTSQGLMAVYQKCAHLGCRVPFCQQSQWFECPCHGSKYNEAGEYKFGPAPTGLWRFKLTVENGTVSVDTSTLGINPPRGTDTIHQSPEGPFCVGGA